MAFNQLPNDGMDKFDPTGGSANNPMHKYILGNMGYIPVSGRRKRRYLERRRQHEQGIKRKKVHHWMEVQSK